MAYQHGIRVEENPTRLTVPIAGTAGLQVVFGTAPVNLAADPAAAVNKLILANTFDEAKSRLGYCKDFANYTLCQSMYATFELFGVAPVVFCNVLDPAKHKATESEKTYTVTNKQATVDVFGMLLDQMVVKKEATTLTADVDYIATFNEDGYVVITLLSSGQAADADTLKVSGVRLDPSAVTARDIIGGLDSASGVETGIELVRQVYPLFGLTPGIILAPGWSKNVSVGAVLSAKTNNINGKFRCISVIDIDTAVATKYQDVAREKDRAGYSGANDVIVWPMIKTAGADSRILSYSAVWAAMTAYFDARNEDVPNLSPSNELLGIGGACIADGTDVVLDETQGNVLNASGIVTAINQSGWRSWGNNTAAYPAIKDPKDRWICCRRFFSWYENSFILTFADRVDDLANYRLVESVVDTENIRGNSLVSQGKCAGIRVAFDIAENPIEKILDGKIRFRTFLAPYTPAEDICNEFEFDPTMLIAALGGQ